MNSSVLCTAKAKIADSPIILLLIYLALLSLCPIVVTCCSAGEAAFVLQAHFPNASPQQSGALTRAGKGVIPLPLTLTKERENRGSFPQTASVHLLRLK